MLDLTARYGRLPSSEHQDLVFPDQPVPATVGPGKARQKRPRSRGRLESFRSLFRNREHAKELLPSSGHRLPAAHTIPTRIDKHVILRHQSRDFRQVLAVNRRDESCYHINSGIQNEYSEMVRDTGFEPVTPTVSR